MLFRSPNFDDLWAAPNMLNTCSFLCVGCYHNTPLSMFCHECCAFAAIGVASTKLNNCSFLWVVCTLDDILDILPYVFLPNSPLIASSMLTNFSFPCFECNEHHLFHNEMDIIVLSKFHGVFVFPHLEIVQNNCLHIDLAYAFF